MHIPSLVSIFHKLQVMYAEISRFLRSCFASSVTWKKWSKEQLLYTWGHSKWILISVSWWQLSSVFNLCMFYSYISFWYNTIIWSSNLVVDWVPTLVCLCCAEIRNLPPVLYIPVLMNPWRKCHYLFRIHFPHFNAISTSLETRNAD